MLDEYLGPVLIAVHDYLYVLFPGADSCKDTSEPPSGHSEVIRVRVRVRVSVRVSVRVRVSILMNPPRRGESPARPLWHPTTSPDPVLSLAPALKDPYI